MIFMHIADDFYLQGILAKLKQKSYWADPENYPTLLTPTGIKRMEKMRHDYIPSLLIHAFSWAFMIMLPIMILVPGINTGVFYALFAFNMSVHAITDHLKANKLRINLWQDQLIHILQIVLTYVLITEVFI